MKRDEKRGRKRINPSANRSPVIWILSQKTGWLISIYRKTFYSFVAWVGGDDHAPS